VTVEKKMVLKMEKTNFKDKKKSRLGGTVFNRNTEKHYAELLND